MHTHTTTRRVLLVLPRQEPDLDVLPAWGVNERDCVGGGGECDPPGGGVAAGPAGISPFVPDPAQACYEPDGSLVPCTSVLDTLAVMRAAGVGVRDLSAEDRAQHGLAARRVL